ncbi:unnamed protein product, partial [Trichobilharzia regenti]
ETNEAGESDADGGEESQNKSKSQENGVGEEGGQDGEEEEEEEDEDDENDDAIIVKVDTDEQSAALGLPRGKYIVKEPLCEEYLPRRFRSVLAAQRAKAAAGDASDSDNASVGRAKRAVIAVETAEDDEVDATLRSEIASTEGSGQQHFRETGGNTTNQATDNQSQNIISLGEELLLLPEGGLGGPVPDEWLTSGAFLTVLTENGQTIGEFQDESYAAYSQNGDEQTVSTSKQSIPEKRKGAGGGGGASTSTKSKPTSKPKTKAEPDAGNNNDNGDVVDLNTLFPGVSVTEVSPGVCLVTKPNGDRFNVEHGGEGITLETLQAILQMDA